MDGIWAWQPMRRLVFARIEDLGGGGLGGLIGRKMVHLRCPLQWSRVFWFFVVPGIMSSVSEQIKTLWI